ncbi:MAG: UbiA family prenyltransferase [Deltaproteobacteria bacterium]|nr:UbiA family prenyltransferase [Deltaproteobacteria bacterium]
MNSSRSKRVLAYLSGMFPPVAAVATLMGFVAWDFVVQSMGKSPVLRISWHTVVGALSLMLFSLLMRIYDELKDVETDLQLAREGDPRYVDRPIVTGAVTVADLVLLRWVVTGLLVALNAPLGFPLPFTVFVGVLAFQWLTFKWFFLKDTISNNLILAFATHQPLVPLLFVYLLSVVATERPDLAFDGRHALAVFAFWFPMASWEIGRKLRARDEETSYDTYTKRLGTRIAPLIPAVLLSVATTITLALVSSRVWIVSQLVLAAFTAVAVFLFARFAITTSRRHSDLRWVVEAYIGVSYFILALDLGIGSAVVFSFA